MGWKTLQAVRYRESPVSGELSLPPVSRHGLKLVLLPPAANPCSDGRFHNRFFAHDRFFRRDHFFIRERSFRHRRPFVSNFAFLGFGFPDWYPNYYGSYPDDYSNNDGEPSYDDQYMDRSSVPTLSELARRSNYTAPLEGIRSFGTPLPRGLSNDRSSYRSTSADERDMDVGGEQNEATGAKAEGTVKVPKRD
jgi:hypothetical protein